MSPAFLLRGADRAAFAAALVARLRAGGVAVSGGGTAGFVQALAQLLPRSRPELYWAARLTLVSRMDDIVAFDAVFNGVFADAILGLDAAGLTGRQATPAPLFPARGRCPPPGGRVRDSAVPDDGGLPWSTRPSAMNAADDQDRGVPIRDVLPSRIVARADEPFERFDREDLRLLGSWLEHASTRWPHRSSLRREKHRGGKWIDLRQTMAASRATGWEAVMLARTRRRLRPRRVVLVCDVSRSMQPYATMYLHLMRAAALRRSGIRPEVFAFSTSLTRLTSVLSHRSAEIALERANAKVTDRYGGTHLGRCIGEMLSAPYGNALRGAVVIVASDGWDSDPPDVLERALVRLRRRAELLVWLNPRAAYGGFQPLAGSMAAALPYCDVFLPAHSLAGLRRLFIELAGEGAHGLRRRVRAAARNGVCVRADAPATPGPPR